MILSTSFAKISNDDACFHDDASRLMHTVYPDPLSQEMKTFCEPSLGVEETRVTGVLMLSSRDIVSVSEEPKDGLYPGYSSQGSSLPWRGVITVIESGAPPPPPPLPGVPTGLDRWRRRIPHFGRLADSRHASATCFTHVTILKLHHPQAPVDTRVKIKFFLTHSSDLQLFEPSSHVTLQRSDAAPSHSAQFP